MPAELIVSDKSTHREIGPLAKIADRASEFVSQSKATNTIRAYRSDWEHFGRWCELHGLLSLPASADTVALYLTDLSGTHKPSSLNRRVAAVSQAHQMAGYESPTSL